MRSLSVALWLALLAAAPAARAGDDPEPPRQAEMTLEAVLKSCPKDQGAVEKLWKVRLGREPTDEEMKVALEHLRKKGRAGRLEAFKDVEWVITNTREFIDRQKARGKGGKPK